MLTRLPTTKIGMTQVYNAQKQVVPVTVVNFSHWYVTQVKNDENDGYRAVQVGRLRKRYHTIPFNTEWLKHKKTYFEHIKEVSCTSDTDLSSYQLGMLLSLDGAAFEVDGRVDVIGTSKGKGFQGVVKRWNFRGGPATHGSNFHRRPGSLGNMRSQGEVLKGKRLPGHCGVKTVTVQGLQIVHVDKEMGCLFIKGSTPGKANSLLVVRKQGI